MSGRGAVASEPVWLSGRTLGALIASCREDHGAAVADAGPAVRDRIVDAPRARFRAGERDAGRLGGELFAVIAAEKGLGPGRLLLGVVATLVFWALNGHDLSARENALVVVARRALGKSNAAARNSGMMTRGRTHDLE